MPTQGDHAEDAGAAASRCRSGRRPVALGTGAAGSVAVGCAGHDSSRRGPKPKAPKMM